MQHHQIKWILSAVVGGVGFLGATASADTITDHFNDYGTATGNDSNNLLGRQSLTPSENLGWAGPWTFETGPDYFAGEQLTYTASGYNNGPNQSGTDDGVAGTGIDAFGNNEGNAGSVARRDFTNGLTGTVWVSALSRYSSNVGETLFWFEGQSNDYIAIRNGANGPEARLRYEGTDTAGGNFAVDTTHLFLARIQMNVGGANDSIDFWVNPDLSGGEGGLSTPTLSGSGLDAFGPTLDGIAVSFSELGSRMDAIRVSNDANGFAQVTAIPEPASLGLLGVGGLLALRRRSR